MLRTHEAGSLRADHAGQTVTLTGWVARRRDHGGVAFIDLRDASGVAQVVIREEAVAQGLRNEYCLQVVGEVTRRPEGNENPTLATGEIEVVAKDVTVLNEAAPLPFQIDEHVEVGEEARLRYRYLDLRRPGTGGRPAVALRGEPGGPRGAARQQLRRDRDAHPDPLHARGRPRLRGARPAGARVLVRPAAEPAAVQAAADGRRHGALLPDRPLLPRRGLPRRPAARVHPARHRDELRRAGRRHRPGRADRGGAVAADRPRGADADPADDLRRRHAPVRHATSPTCASASSSSSCTEYFAGHRLPGVPGRVRRRGGHARRCEPAPQDAGRLAGVGQAARRPGPGLRAGRRGRRARRPGRQEPLRGRARRPGRSRSARGRGTASSSPPAPLPPREPCSVPPGSRSAGGWA